MTTVLASPKQAAKPRSDHRACLAEAGSEATCEGGTCPVTPRRYSRYSYTVDGRGVAVAAKRWCAIESQFVRWRAASSGVGP